ncbi:hypothetical protein HY994_06190 [Candidatus Micrarchaeota archaeon]|nr:hypothetical protein [Candidatus Micrarchaeota archaeon]
MRKEKNGASDFVLPNKRPLPFSASFVLHPPPRLRGQGSVEYLFVVVFLVGFIVAVLVPSLQTAEITYALAGARTAAVGYETNQTDIRLTRMNYSVDHDQVRLVLTVYNRSADANIAAPQGLKDAVLSGIHVLAPTYGVNGSCANTSNYEYCVVS